MALNLDPVAWRRVLRLQDTDELTITFQEITPAIAREWLGTFTRADLWPTTQQQCDEVAGDILAGRWNSEADVFLVNHNERIRRGHLRCCAIVAADVAVSAWVIRCPMREVFRPTGSDARREWLKAVREAAGPPIEATPVKDEPRVFGLTRDECDRLPRSVRSALESGDVVRAAAVARGACQGKIRRGSRETRAAVQMLLMHARAEKGRRLKRITDARRADYERAPRSCGCGAVLPYNRSQCDPCYLGRDMSASPPRVRAVQAARRVAVGWGE